MNTSLSAPPPTRESGHMGSRPYSTSQEKKEGSKRSYAKEVLDSLWADALAYLLAIVILLNFWSAAFLELVMYVVFYPLCPSIWYVTRILGVRFGWLFPMLCLKWSNVRIRMTGKGAAATSLGAIPPSPFSFSSSWQRYRDLLTPGKLPRAFIMINHLSWADTFVLSPWLHAHNSVNGDTCWPMWKGFMQMPLGWIAYMSECPVLGYGKEVDLKTIHRSVTQFFERRMTKFFLFPEGAVFREEMRSKSHQYATANKLPLLDHCLLPKHGAFCRAGKELHRQGMTTLVDLTLAYPPASSLYDAPFNVLDLVKRHAKPLYLPLHVRTFAMSEVPWDEEGKVQDWLNQRFMEKDKMLEEYYQNNGGALVEGAVEEGSRWQDLLMDLCVWIVLQAVMYGALLYLGRRMLGYGPV